MKTCIYYVTGLVIAGTIRLVCVPGFFSAFPDTKTLRTIFKGPDLHSGRLFSNTIYIIPCFFYPSSRWTGCFLVWPDSVLCRVVLFYPLFFNMFVNIEHISRKTPDLPENLPSIDVFIPTYNEEEEVAYATALACKNFDYPPHLVNIYILNDGGRLPRLNTPELTEKLITRHQRLSELAAQAGAFQVQLILRLIFSCE